jgi:S-(hydroxymethyl)glutathione dehydrogenase/alcohol dehydrogenase
LGHEASGTVLEVGPGVTTKKVSDPVVLHWRPGLGIQSTPPAYKWRGKALNAGWVTTFNDHAIVSENRLTVIPADFDRKVAPLLGCAVTTALGVINNDAKVKIGESVVILGTGGVGLNLVQCAQMAGAHPIVAVDLIDAKLQLARRIGATHTVNAHADGSCILIGVPTEKVTIATLPLHFNKVLTGSHGGDSRPNVDIPRLIRLSKAGRMSFDGMITHEFELERINDAIATVRSGQAGRVLVNMS